MFWIDLIIAVLIAFVFSIFLIAVIRWRRPGTSGIWPTLSFLLIFLFLVIWAGGIWLIPFGPKFLSINWLPFIVSAITISLILVTLIPPQTGRKTTVKLVRTEEKNKQETNDRELITGIFFWVLILALIAVIVIKYALIK